MLLEFLSTVFDFNQFTGFEHVRTTTLLTILGLLSIAIWIIIALSMIVRHLATFVLRSFSYGHRFNTSKGVGKDHDR
ncbi:hypothetical protein D3C73_18380 [compost metagenome]